MNRVTLTFIFALAALAFLVPARVAAQLPFYTDDADTTEKGKVHIEFSNEIDWLQKSELPAKRQNTTVVSLAYGLTKRIEIGADGPLIKISSEPDSPIGSPLGYGDTQLTMKVKVHDEKEGSRMPALAVVFAVELPSGSVHKEIGSGLTDYWLYGVIQKSFTKRTTGRLNGGILFAGNSSTGLIGIETARGQVFTGNGSILRNFTPKLTLGVELFGAVSNNFDLALGQLEGQVGGVYSVKPNFAITFGFVGGHFPASPKFGLNAGFTYDF